MSGVFAASASVPPIFWLITGIGLIATAAGGFYFGQYFARGATQRAFHRASNNLNQLFGLTIDSIDSAQKACGLLQSFPNLQLSETQLEKLTTRQSGLAKTFTNIAESQLELFTAEEAPALPPEPVEIAWDRTPEDMLTGFPDRVAFDTNLSKLLDAGREAAFESGLLLVKIDKLDQLKIRFGMKGVNEFTKRVGSLICRSIRDEDLVCRYNDSMFGVLIPAVDSTTGRRIAAVIRDTVRHHHFRLEEGGPEVLVTASFGFTTFAGLDNADLVLNRAGTALAKSEKRGRNQLHTHDGQTAQLCAAS